MTSKIFLTNVLFPSFLLISTVGAGPIYAALHANPEADLADRERLTQPAALPPDDDALEHLHAGSGALDHSDVHPQGVTWTEVGHVLAQRVGVQTIEGVHHVSLSSGTADIRHAASWAPVLGLARPHETSGARRLSRGQPPHGATTA